MLFNFLVEFHIGRLKGCTLSKLASLCPLKAADFPVETHLILINPNVPLRPFTKAEFADQSDKSDKPIAVSHFVAQVLIKSYENRIRTSEMNFQVRRSSKSAASNFFQEPSLRNFIKKKLE